MPHNTATRIEEYIARYFQPRIGVGIDTTYNPWTLYYLQKNAEMTDQGIFDSNRRADPRRASKCDQQADAGQTCQAVVPDGSSG